MTEEMNDTLGQQAPTVPATDETQVVETASANLTEAADEVDLFEEGDEENPFAEGNAAEEAAAERQFVIIRTTGGDDRYIDVEGPTPLVDILTKAAIRFTSTPEFLMNGATITATTYIPVGATVTIIGSVKGG